MLFEVIENSRRVWDGFLVFLEHISEIIQTCYFFLIDFFKIMSSYKLPESFEQIVVIDGLEGEILVGDSEMDSKLWTNSGK